jgi:hypothetical protein
MVNSVVRWASTDGASILLSKFSGKATAGEMAKYIPMIGPVIAGGLSFGITKLAANQYVDECHKVAKAVLEREMGLSN